MASYTLTTPIADEEIRRLQVGDTIYLNGVIITAGTPLTNSDRELRQSRRRAGRRA